MAAPPVNALHPNEALNKPTLSFLKTPKLISVPSVGNLSTGRTLRAIQTLNRDAASTDHGASVKVIEELGTPPEGVIPPDSFVAYIIKYNQEDFDKILENQFCKDMGAADTDAEVAKVLKGYKWYTVQDFIYSEGLVRYEAARAANAPTIIDVLNGASDIQSSYKYAESVLETCSKQLGIPEDKVLNAQKEAATENYTKFEIKSARDEDWVTSEIAMIPCIQGYYQIAKKMSQTSKRKDTPWYKGWVEANLSWDYCAKQIKFFEANAKDWKKATPAVEERWHKIFKTACQHEVEFFAIGENPKDI